MYKPKPCGPCVMPAPGTPLRALVLNASLKHAPEASNTQELAELVLEHLRPHRVTADVVRLADLRLPVGLGYRESDGDEWPAIVAKLKAADIVLFATPIWWGGRSSLMQRVIERMDALDEEYIANGRSALYNKVAGIVITGSEDGALSTMGSIMMVLTWMGFTLPPECAAYWVGEVGQPPSGDAAKRRANEATQHMAKNLARNLVYYAQLLKERPLVMANA
jgi:multimeric flavodoxin WrbA